MAKRNQNAARAVQASIADAPKVNAPALVVDDKPKAPAAPKVDAQATITVPAGTVDAARTGALTQEQIDKIKNAPYGNVPAPTADGSNLPNAIRFEPATHTAGEALAAISTVVHNIGDAARTLNMGLFSRLIGPVADLLHFLKMQDNGTMPTEKAFRATIREHITKPMQDADKGSYSVASSNVSNAITGAYRVAVMFLEPKPKAPRVSFHWFAKDSLSPIRFFWVDGDGKEHGKFAETEAEARDTLTKGGAPADTRVFRLPTVPHNALYPKGADGRTMNETVTPYPLSLNWVNKVWKGYEYKGENGAHKIDAHHKENVEAVKAARDAVGKLGLQNTLTGLADIIGDDATKLEANDRAALLATTTKLVDRIYKVRDKTDKATLRAIWSLFASLQAGFRIDDDGDFYVILDTGREQKVDIAETN